MDASSSIRSAIIIVVAISLALWLGVSIVTDQTQTLLYASVAALFLTCIFLGRRIWLLLIFFMALNVPVIRGFGTAEIGQSLFIGFIFVIFLLRRQPLNFKFTELEVWMLLLAACVVQVYLRNPVGLNMFSADAVGARPYFKVALAFIAAVILGNVVVKPGEIKWAMRLTIIGSFLGLGLTALRMRGAGPIQPVYDPRAKFDSGQGSGRIGILGEFATYLSRVVASYVSPLRALLHPFWAPLILISVAAAAGSGFRNNVAGVGLTYLIAIAYRGGFASVMLAALSGAMGLALLAFVNVMAPLPANIQRALSPFPGTWEARHVKAAKDSTEWRVDMWKEALFTDYWIHNKILGDGLGLSKREFELLQAMEESGGRSIASLGSGMTAQQEGMMITGGYHSGPVQCVRVVGYVGLLVLMTFMVRNAVHAHHQIKRCRGTEWQTPAFFMCIPIIAQPIFFTLIVGDFGNAGAGACFAYAMLRLLEKNLPLPAYVRRKHVPFMLQNRNLAAASGRTAES
jgi:hypothetical protein